jgi:hypothetical protein
MLGSWQRINDKSGNNTYEKWYATMDGKYIGYGHTVKNGDTIFQEHLSIKTDQIISKTRASTYILEVTGVNDEPTKFVIEKMDDYSFTAVNLKNEFPTHITYSMVNDTLAALVSNKEYAVDFKFLKFTE